MTAHSEFVKQYSNDSWSMRKRLSGLMRQKKISGQNSKCSQWQTNLFNTVRTVKHYTIRWGGSSKEKGSWAECETWDCSGKVNSKVR